MNRSLLRSFLFILLGTLIMPALVAGCRSNEPNEMEITYRFSTTGENCQGISFGWVNEDGETETCHESFTDGNVDVDCPTPKSVSVVIDKSNELERLTSVSSYISVSKLSACLARCEIWLSENLNVSDEVATIEDEQIASCRARIN